MKKNAIMIYSLFLGVAGLFTHVPVHAAVSEKENVFYSQEADPQEWGRWFKGRRKYINETQDLLKKAVDIEKMFHLQFSALDQQLEPHKAQELVDSASKKISLIVERISDIPVPEELLPYHDKIVASGTYMAKSIKASLAEGARYASYKITSLTMAMDAIGYLKETYNTHGASQEELDRLSCFIDEGLLAKNN